MVVLRARTGSRPSGLDLGQADTGRGAEAGAGIGFGRLRADPFTGASRCQRLAEKTKKRQPTTPSCQGRRNYGPCLAKRGPQSLNGNGVVAVHPQRTSVVIKVTCDLPI